MSRVPHALLSVFCDLSRVGSVVNHHEVTRFFSPSWERPPVDQFALVGVLQSRGHTCFRGMQSGSSVSFLVV